jgi:hypothetical protein
LVDEEDVTVAASKSTAGAVLRRVAIGGSATVLGALLFCAGPAGAITDGHASSAQATAHRHPSSHDKQAAERAAKQAAERAKRAAQAKAKAEHAKAEHAKAAQAKRAAQANAKAEHAKAEHARAEHARAEHAKAEHAKAEHTKARQQAAVERQASQTAAEAATAAAKAQAAVTKALRKADLPTGGNQPVTPAGKPAVLTSSTGQQLAPAASATKASTTKLAGTALRQAAAVGSVFTSGNAVPVSKQPAPVSKPARHPAAAKPRTTVAAPPARLIQIQTPIRLAEAAGLSLGAGPMVLLGLVVVGGLATVIAGTRRRSSARRG